MIAPGWRSLVWWIALAIACALLLAAALRGYLHPAFVIDLANQQLC
jgi:hypothetical protein